MAPRRFYFKKATAGLAFGMMMACTAAWAQLNPFSGGWTLQPEMSSLNFQSVKKQTVVETSSFATVEGEISDTGQSELRVYLDSVDTQNDLRNVRMRFLFFETFNHPVARVTAQIDAGLLSDLDRVRRKTVLLDYTLDLHGVTKSFSADVAVTLLGENMVSVASRTPISVSVADFNLSEGLTKLEEAVDVVILPSATVSFDFVFARAGSQAVAQAPRQEEGQAVVPASLALEAQGDFDDEACEGRFEILSRSGNIFFASGSARLTNDSVPLLNTLSDVVLRCPGMVIEVGGHTDAVGSDAANAALSERRASSVVQFLQQRGITAERLISRGYGEAFPIASNDTAEGQRRNRRIEFKVVAN